MILLRIFVFRDHLMEISGTANSLLSCMRFRDWMYIIIFEEKAEIQDQFPLSLNPVQEADDPVQDRNRNIGPLDDISEKK